MKVHPTLLGWIIFIFGLYLINKMSKTGHVIIFYAVLLILIFLLAANARAVLGVSFTKDQIQ